MADIGLLNFVNTEKTLTVYITATDYANNETTVSKTFYYDRKYTYGTLSTGNSTATSVECYFDAYSDISGVMFSKFVLVTSQNGKSVRTEVYGTKVSANRWKITLDRNTLNSTTGEFSIDVWSSDNINNYGYVGAVFHRF
ncbi:hypothetical protein [Acetivibrio cellulolyticus]|uniref:hypothetical protein n=1 Tax=Acetivibrio cellulolyticus TaxID=35830 RepID=UPI0001E2BE1F|nr:hypothetical protein [Acetivibrio cellulolyticus]